MTTRVTETLYFMLKMTKSIVYQKQREHTTPGNILFCSLAERTVTTLKRICPILKSTGTRRKRILAMMENSVRQAVSLLSLELFNLAAHYSPDKTAEELHAEYRDRNKTLNSNPMLADWLFTKRATDYLQNNMANLYCFTDYWARIEHQHRGSAHMHGVGWTRDSPIVSYNNTKFWNIFISQKFNKSLRPIKCKKMSQRSMTKAF